MPNMIYTVEQLSSEIKDVLEKSYPDVWIEGEVASVSMPSSGHIYFALKENNSILKCVLFKNKKYLATSLPADGARILIRGKISMYTGRGDVQLICSYIEAAGEGELRRQFEALKSKLAAEGLFDAENKQAIPTACKHIALITSPSGAVLHDIISTLSLRYPFARLSIYPTRVQGQRASDEIIEQLKIAIDDTPDVIVLARGGGSMEDLLAFNDEALARAISSCPVPLVSAIGHETDTVISDFVADLRAPTPTAAAALITPDIAELKRSLAHLNSSLGLEIEQKLATLQQGLDITKQRLKHPADRLGLQSGLLEQSKLKLRASYLEQLQDRGRHLAQLKLRLRTCAPAVQMAYQSNALNRLNFRLDKAIQNLLVNKYNTLERLNIKNNAFSPHHTLARGYAIVQNAEGALIRSANELKLGDSVQAKLYRGSITATVDSKTNT